MSGRNQIPVPGELERLREENARLRSALEEAKALLAIAPAFFGFLSAQGIVLALNDLALQNVDAAFSPIVGRLLWECPWWLPFPASVERIRQAVEAAARGVTSQFDLEYWSTKSGRGQKCWGAICVSPWAAGAGTISRIVVTCTNVTERVEARKRAEESELSLAAERHKLEVIFQESPAAMAIWRGPELIFDKVNPRYQAIFGERELLEKAFVEALPEFKDQPFPDLIRRVLETGEPFIGHEERARLSPTADSPLEDRYYDFTYSRVNDREGRPYGVYDHAVDVTDRVLARKRLEESESRFRQLADSMPTIVWTARADGALDYFNRRWYEFSGAPEGALEDAVWQVLLHPDDIPRCTQNWLHSIKTGAPYEVEYRFKERTTGEYRWQLGRAVAVRDESGAIIKWFGSSTDIHDVKQTQEELVRVNTELGRFAYVASHDLKEPLRSISSYSQLIARRYQGQIDETANLYIQYIKQGVDRMYELINDLLSFSRIGALAAELRPIDLNHVLTIALENLDSAIRESRAEIMADPLPTVMSESSQMLQLFQNLIGNAVKYRAPRPPKIAIRVREQENHWLFSIQDNGIGIPAAYFDKIFVLFQRLHSKDQYSGTGIGLAVCRKIVDNLGGRIWVESKVGEGTTFYFTARRTKENVAELSRS